MEIAIGLVGGIIRGVMRGIMYVLGALVYNIISRFCRRNRSGIKREIIVLVIK